MSEWDYRDLGFNSQEEMEASIAKAREAKLNPKSGLEEQAANAEKYRAHINEYGGIELEKLKEGARVQALDEKVMRKLHWEEQDRKAQKRADEINELLKKAGESSAIDRQKAAEKKIQEETEKAEAEIRARHLKEQGLNSDGEIKTNNYYASLLRGLKGE